MSTNKNIRTRKIIREYLAKEDKSTLEIYEYINKRLKNGILMHTLCALLGSEKDIVMGELTMDRYREHRRYETHIWHLKDS